MEQGSLPDRAADPGFVQASRGFAGSIDRRPRFVVAVDQSLEAEVALREAVGLARRVGASLVLLHVAKVVGPSSFAGPRTWARAEEAARDTGEEILQEAGRLAGDVVVARELQFGDPVEVICRLARELEADLVVLGSRRRSWLERLLDSSVSVGVAARAPCSVLVVRGPDAEAEIAPSGTSSA
jgi:nucleotide-binding universal stress UspA family protein